MGEMENIITRIDKIEKKVEKQGERLTEIEKDNSVQAYQFKQIMDILAELKADVTELKNKPNKRWDLVVTTLLGGLVMYFLNKFLM